MIFIHGHIFANANAIAIFSHRLFLLLQKREYSLCDLDPDISKYEMNFRQSILWYAIYLFWAPFPNVC